MDLDMKLKFNFNKRNRYNNNCNVIDYTIIDAEDINKISKYKISKCGNYAYANINNKQVALHRIITNTILELLKIQKLLYLKMVDLLVILV